MISASQLDRIEKLAELKRIGALSDQEFEHEKAKILAGGPVKGIAARSTGDTTSTSVYGDYSQSFHIRAQAGSPWEWMVMPVNRYLDFGGRSRRKEYWMFAAGQAFLWLALLMIFLVIQSAASVGLLFITASLTLAIPSIAVIVRRFHDQDLSGWFALLLLMPYIGALCVLVFMCMPGTKGSNRYGPDPITD